MGNKKRLSLSEIQEHWIASLMIFLSVSVAILDFLGFLDSVPVIANRVPVLILLLLSTLTGYVAFVRTDADTKMHHDLLKRTAQINETIETIDSLKEIRVRSFKNFDECLNYANRQISQAKLRVYSVYWDAELNFGQQLTNGIQHREIFIIDDTNRDYYFRHLRARLNGSTRTYSSAYFRTSTDTTLQFLIIDTQEIIFLSNLSSHNIAVRHPVIVQLFEHSYNEMWSKAIKLKQFDRVYADRIDVALAIPSQPIPADLEKCIQSCLEKHRELKQVNQDGRTGRTRDMVA